MSSEHWRLESVDGAGLSMSLAGRDTLSVGRREGQDVRLDNVAVSREHAVLRRTGRGWAVTDLGSTSGTKIDGRAIAPGTMVPLSHGSTLAFGPCQFTLRGPDSAIGSLRTMVETDGATAQMDEMASAKEGMSGGQLDALMEASGHIASARNRDDVARLAIQELSSVTGLANVAFLVGSVERDAWHPLANVGSMVEGGEVRISRSLMRRVASEGKPFIWRRGSSNTMLGQSVMDLQLEEICAAPAKVGDRIYGYIVADNRGRGSRARVSLHDVGRFFFSVAHIAALALHGLEREQEVREQALANERLFKGALNAFLGAVDLKDTYTRGHTERVARLAQLLARAALLSDEACEQVYLAGRAHDVGKLLVSDAALKKQGALTPEEFEEIKRHPAHGWEIMKEVPGWEPMLLGIRNHHEKWTGGGYPDGLTGEGIPLIARIIGIADVFDALTSNRSYRSAMSMEKALQIIREGLGTHFDPVLGEVFLQIPRAELGRLIGTEPSTVPTD